MIDFYLPLFDPNDFSLNITPEIREHIYIPSDATILSAYYEIRIQYREQLKY